MWYHHANADPVGYHSKKNTHTQKHNQLPFRQGWCVAVAVFELAPVGLSWCVKGFAYTGGIWTEASSCRLSSYLRILTIVDERELIHRSPQLPHPWSADPYPSRCGRLPLLCERVLTGFEWTQSVRKKQPSLKQLGRSQGLSLLSSLVRGVLAIILSLARPSTFFVVSVGRIVCFVSSSPNQISVLAELTERLK